MFEKIVKAAAPAGTAKVAQLDAASVVSRLAAAVPELQKAVQAAQERLDTALLAEQMGDDSAGVAPCKKALSASQDSLADAERGLAAARRKQADQQAQDAAQALADQWSLADQVYAKQTAAAVKVEAAILALTESFAELVEVSGELTRAVPVNLGHVGERVSPAGLQNLTTLRMRDVIPALSGGTNFIGGQPTVVAAVADVWAALNVHHRQRSA